MEDYLPYSKRLKKAERAGHPVVFQYLDLPDTFRVQAFFALTTAIYDYSPIVPEIFEAERFWSAVEERVCRERGIPELGNPYRTDKANFADYLRSEKIPSKFIDAIEIAFRLAHLWSLDGTKRERDGKLAVSAVAISELNKRFLEHDLGYQFVASDTGGQIIRLDSQYIHSEIVEPAIAVLGEPGFEGALDEFMNAHREYRHGHHKDAMNEALKALESTMKAISMKMGWAFDAGWTASKLIALMVEKGLFSTSQESYFAGFRSALESGVPTLRNKQSGHGQGAAIIPVPDYMAAFALHLTASNIVFLMAAYNDMISAS